jgi:hypothetical protein
LPSPNYVSTKHNVKPVYLFSDGAPAVSSYKPVDF